MGLSLDKASEISEDICSCCEKFVKYVLNGCSSECNCTCCTCRIEIPMHECLSDPPDHYSRNVSSEEPTPFDSERLNDSHASST